jgi:hypothetical protein
MLKHQIEGHYQLQEDKAHLFTLMDTCILLEVMGKDKNAQIKIIVTV